MKLNLGSGHSSKIGYTNVDIYPFDNVDIVHDLEEIPYPFDDNSAVEIYMSHSLEHVSMTSVPSLLRECYRILQKNGNLIIIVPCIECAMKRFLNEPEESRWGYVIEYILGNQGRSQQGDQYHKSGFTPAYLKKLVEDAGFKVKRLFEVENNLKMNCIHLDAQKQ